MPSTAKRLLLLTTLGAAFAVALYCAKPYLLPTEDVIPPKEQARLDKAAADNSATEKLTDLQKQRKQIVTTQPAISLAGHTDGILSVDFSPDGKTLLTGSGDTTIKLWSLSPPQLLHTFEGHSKPVFSVRFSPDGKSFLSSGPDGNILLWDVASRSILNCFPEPNYLFETRFLPDGKHFVSRSAFRIQYWSIDSEKSLAQLPGTQFRHIDVHANEVAISEEEGVILLWNPLTNKIIDKRERLHTDVGVVGDPQRRNHVLGLRFLPNADLLITDIAGTWRWNRSTNSVDFIAKTSRIGIPLLDPTYFASRSSADGLCFCTLSEGWDSRPLAYRQDHDSNHDIALSPDGNTLAFAYGGSFGPNQTWYPAAKAPSLLIYDTRIVPLLHQLDQQIQLLARQISRPVPSSRATQPAQPGIPWK